MEAPKPDEKTIDEKTMHAVRHALQSHAALIAWRSKYEQGVFIIDEQHRAIIAVINSLYYAMQNNHGIDMLHPVVGMIAEYTRIHFETEEAFHRKCDFPDAEQHHSLHLELIRKMSKIARKARITKTPISSCSFSRIGGITIFAMKKGYSTSILRRRSKRTGTEKGTG